MRSCWYLQLVQLAFRATTVPSIDAVVVEFNKHNVGMGCWLGSGDPTSSQLAAPVGQYIEIPSLWIQTLS